MVLYSNKIMFWGRHYIKASLKILHSQFVKVAVHVVIYLQSPINIAIVISNEPFVFSQNVGLQCHI